MAKTKQKIKLRPGRYNFQREGLIVVVHRIEEVARLHTRVVYSFEGSPGIYWQKVDVFKQRMREAKAVRIGD